MVSIGLLLMRLIVGSIFAVHGYTKVFGGPGKGRKVGQETEAVLGEQFTERVEQGGIPQTTGMLKEMGVPNPGPSAMALAAAELGGGLALIFGWQTRLAGLALTGPGAIAID